MTGVVSPNDRVMLRDRPWLVRRVSPIANGYHLLDLEALDDDYPPTLVVAVPPDVPTPLPAQELEFDLGQVDSFSAWSRAHRILAATLTREVGLLSGAGFGRVVLESYQLAPALRVLSKPRPSLLIADDVGLGKTVEAGLALLELMARNRAERVLVVVPPGLVEQWRDELSDKLGLQFTVIADATELIEAQTQLPAGVSPWDALPRVITSMDFIKKETVRSRALRKPWDLVIVDEAHALAESGTPSNPYSTQRTRLGRALRDASRGMLLLTATPHNGYPHSFRSLVELVEPTLATLHGDEEALRRRVETAVIRRMKSQIRRRLPDGREQPAFPPRSVAGIVVTNLTDGEKELLRRVASYCSRTARQAAGTQEAELIGFAMQIIKKRSLSSRLALERTLEHRLEALRKEDARETPPEPGELREYQADLPLTEEQSERTARRILRSAIPREERQRRAEVRAWRDLQRLLRSLPDRDPKIEALIEEIRSVHAVDPNEKIIVFTEYRDTLEAICQRLEREPDLAGRYVTLTGGLTRRQRLERQEQFDREDVRLLVATDAASEGLNLQRHCRRVVHFELPWNPNHMEQRNGRVDRYGQTRDTVIRYLYYPDSPEDDVLATLVQKVTQIASDRVSTPDILGVLAGHDRIERELLDLDPTAPDVAGRKAAIVKMFEDRTGEFIRQGTQLLAALAADGADRVEQLPNLLTAAEPLLRDDHELERTVLDILGGAARPDPHREGVYRLEVPFAYRGDGVRPVYDAVTFRRSVAVRYPAEEVEFITPLHPLVKALAADARRTLVQVYRDVRGLPPRRLAVRAAGGGEPPSIVFTFLVTIRGASAALEERLLAVRVGPNGELLGSPEENLRFVWSDGSGGEVQPERLRQLFGNSFQELYRQACTEAQRYAEQRTRELAESRSGQAVALLQDLEVDVAARLEEIEHEERAAHGNITASGQLRLFDDEGRSTPPASFRARRAAVESYRKRRLEEIEAFKQVHLQGPPRALGALFLVPPASGA